MADAASGVGPAPAPGPRLSQVTALNFDDASSSAAVGNAFGFKVFRCNPFAKCYEMHGPNTALLAVSLPAALLVWVEAPPAACVTSQMAGPCRRSWGHTVHLHSLTSSRRLQTLRFPGRVIVVHLVGELLLVACDCELYVYCTRQFPLYQLHVFHTLPNPRGLLAHTLHQSTVSIAYPSNLVGDACVAVAEITQTETPAFPFGLRLRTTCALPLPAHQVTLMHLSRDATLLVVALGSAKGIQLTDTRNPQRSASVVWRGLGMAQEVVAMGLSPDNALLCVAAGSGTVSVHDVSKALQAPGEEDEEAPSFFSVSVLNSSMEFVTQLKEFVHPRAFASFDIPKRHGHPMECTASRPLCAWLDATTLAIVAGDGRLFRLEVRAGECRVREAYGLTDDHVWLLGLRYDLWLLPAEGPYSCWDDGRALMARLHSLLCFTYRADFLPIGKYKTSDAAWGCMLRTGQMILAQAFRVHHHVDVLTGPKLPPGEAARRDAGIAAWFCDLPGSPYSVHRIAQAGERRGKPVGDWFSPTLIATVLQELVETNHSLHGDRFRVYVADTATLYLNQIEELFAADPAPALLLLVPVMLGASPLANPLYFPALCRLFHLPEFLGVVGGKPGASYYFIGYQVDTSCRLVYLDPHAAVHPALTNITAQSRETLRQTPLLTMPIARLDPSLVLGFYCRDRDSLQSLVARTEEVQEQCGATMFTWQAASECGDRSFDLKACPSNMDVEWRMVQEKGVEGSPQSISDRGYSEFCNDEEWEEVGPKAEVEDPGQ